MKRSFFISLFLISLLLTEAKAIQCNVCHSKNPKMVKMHKALGFKDCFKCHGFKKAQSKEELNRQMTSDERCIGCHSKKSP